MVSDTTNQINCQGIHVPKKRLYVTGHQLLKANCHQQVTFHADTNMKIKFTFTNLNEGGNRSHDDAIYLIDGSDTVPLNNLLDGRDRTVESKTNSVSFAITISGADLLIAFQGEPSLVPCPLALFFFKF